MRDYVGSTVHQQETDYKIIKSLLPFIHHNTFLDIGAERGTFAEFLINEGYTGACFEPLPKHAATLEKLSQKTGCLFSNAAISDKDGIASFHIASDEKGEPLDYFHSLELLQNDARVTHNRSITVNCRTLNSLLAENYFDKQVGILKVDTEGNDLRVLTGATHLQCDLIICEFFTPGLYAGWEKAHPQGLINAAKNMGFDNYLSIARIDEFEQVTLNTKNFLDKQWGNLIFISNDVFARAMPDILTILTQMEFELLSQFVNVANTLKNEINVLRSACEDRLNLINHLNLEINTRNS